MINKFYDWLDPKILRLERWVNVQTFLKVFRIYSKIVDFFKKIEG